MNPNLSPSCASNPTPNPNPTPTPNPDPDPNPNPKQEPLLREASCLREMNAVDSEFRRNLQSDARRIFQLVKSTSSPDHPFRKFSTGNLQTL